MKTLQNHLILYDAECPMCNLYTKAFVSSGLLGQDGRAAYQDVDNSVCPMVDRQRAVNEIALVNQTTGEVTYGIKSLFKVFATAAPTFSNLFEFEPFVWVMSKFYAFISYNRRVIVPAAKLNYSFQIQPAFKLKYRIAYLIFTALVTAYILTAYVHLMKGGLPQGNNYREYMICVGQLFFQGLIVRMIAKNKTWDYLGNMMTISFAGGLLLLPGLLFASIFHINPIVYAVYFMLVAGLMFLEHIRRTGMLKLGWTLTISWACYRLIILIMYVIDISY